MEVNPAISVIVPVHNRDASLRRALDSVSRQTLTDFECLVVDDGSDVDIRSVVESLCDPRLRYIRRDENGGPYVARFRGMQSARGRYTLFLDSDWELYPWALDQARRHLDETPSVDMVCGLHVRNEDSRLFVRVRNAPLVASPDDARREGLIPDRVGVVRRCVVDEWLQKDPGYFAFEGHQFLTAKLVHAQLYVDEPWSLYHTSGADRITARGNDNRVFEDMQRFLSEHRQLIEDAGQCGPIDALVRQMYFVLWRARRPEAKLAANGLRARGIAPRRALAHEVAYRMKRRLFPATYATHWVGVGTVGEGYSKAARRATIRDALPRLSRKDWTPRW